MGSLNLDQMIVAIVIGLGTAVAFFCYWRFMSPGTIEKPLSAREARIAVTKVGLGSLMVFVVLNLVLPSGPLQTQAFIALGAMVFIPFVYFLGGALDLWQACSYFNLLVTPRDLDVGWQLNRWLSRERQGSTKRSP